MLVAQVAVFLQCLVDDPFQFGWHVGIAKSIAGGKQ
jgi:hypothetical protein